MFNVNADLFRMTALFQSTEETRYYLCGVHLEPHPEGGVLMVATDGFRMLVAHDVTGQCEGSYIVRLDKKALAETKPGKTEKITSTSRRLVADNATDPAWITEAKGEQLAIVKGWNVDGTFPDWRRVCGQSNPAVEHQAFNPGLFAEFATVARELYRHEPSISIETSANGSPAWIRFAGSDHVFGLLMPTPKFKGEKGRPAFMLPKVETQAAAAQGVAA